MKLASGEELNMIFVDLIILPLELFILPVDVLVFLLNHLSSVAFFKYLVLHALARDSQSDDFSLTSLSDGLLLFKPIF